MRSLRIEQFGLLGGVGITLALSGCNSFDEKMGPNDVGPQLVIPVDERSVQTSTVAKPITGGTLLVTADGKFAVAADPDRDRLSIVDLTTMALRHTVALEPGDEPGRSIEDGSKHIHVALRKSGAVVSIDPESGAILDRRAVCKAPRGIAFDTATSLIHVACSEGKLVSMAAAGGAAVRTLTLDADLRDVLVRGTELWVSRFKSAELLRVNEKDGTLASRVTLPLRTGVLTQPTKDNGQDRKEVAVQPGVAWRAVSSPGGGAVLVHQDAVADEIEIPPPSTSGSAYGGGAGGFDCSGIVKTTVTKVNPDGTTTSTPIAGAPLAVDVAMSLDQKWIAVAHAGPADFEAPRPFTVFPGQDGASSGGGPVAFGGGSTLSINSVSSLTLPGQTCMMSEGFGTMDAVTAVTFTGDGRLIAQSQDPPQLLVIQAAELPWGSPMVISLPGESHLDTGHQLFHRDSGGGIACASCHPEGTEDGHTWRFADVGERRTQALNVGLKGTAPFHWNGDLANVGALMSEVFVQRMGGVRQSTPRVERLTNWLFEIPTPPAIRDASDEAAVRGKALFESAQVGCATCHTGEKLTNNQTVAIDTVDTKKLQVPSLVAIGYRAPFMHTGCAANLKARFDPACGGDAHGNVSDLSEAQVVDLVAYLESL